MTKNLVFPILLCSKSFIELINNLDHLQTTNKVGFQKKNLVNLRIVDSKGDYYNIDEMIFIKYRNPFWKFEFFNPTYNIELKLSQLDTINFNEFKIKLNKIIKNNLSFWQFDYKKEVDLVFNKSNNISELISNLSSYT